MKCSVCGSELPEGAAFCGSCGAAVTGQFCGNCGREIPAGAQECPYCTGERTVRVEDPGGIHCPVCGHPLSIGESFCGNCGYRFQKKSSLPIIAAIAAGLAVLSTAAAILLLVMGDRNGETEAEIYSPSPTVSVQPAQTPLIAVAVPTVTAPTVTVTPATAVPKQQMYLFNSDSEYITTEYLNTKTRQEVRMILNEIYARHGYIFNNEAYQQYFSAQPWYVPRYTSDIEAEKHFNSVETANKNTIVNYEIAHQWR